MNWSLELMLNDGNHYNNGHEILVNTSILKQRKEYSII